jgi:hypothetical protein
MLLGCATYFVYKQFLQNGYVHCLLQWTDHKITDTNLIPYLHAYRLPSHRSYHCFVIENMWQIQSTDVTKYVTINSVGRRYYEMICSRHNLICKDCCFLGHKSLVEVYRCFGRTCGLHLQGCLSWTLVNIYPITWQHIPEDRNPQSLFWVPCISQIDWISGKKLLE